MTREALLEVLAREIHAVRYPEAWENSNEQRRGWCYADAATMVDGVIAWFAGWLEFQFGKGDVLGRTLVANLREEMGVTQREGV